MHAGSVNDRLARMAVGDVIFTETTHDAAQGKMRQLASPRTRRPPNLQGREFVSRLYTCVGAMNAADIRYIIRTERTA